MDSHRPLAVPGDRLAKVLEIALYSAAGSPDNEGEARAEMIQARLSDSVPRGQDSRREVERLLVEACQKFREDGGPLLGETLTNGSASLDDLTAIKNAMKHEVGVLPEGPARQVSTALYYAAIAAAIIAHRTRITKLPPSRLREKFVEYAAATWVTGELAILFQRASRTCREGGETV